MSTTARLNLSWIESELKSRLQVAVMIFGGLPVELEFGQVEKPDSQTASEFRTRSPNGAGVFYKGSPLDAWRLHKESRKWRRNTSLIKLQVAAGQTNPSPPVGPALGQHGVNIMEFCKAFNAQTQQLDAGAPVPVVITVYNDRSFTFTMKTPPASYLLKKAAKIKSGSGEPNTKKVGKVTRAQLEEIAKAKEPDLTAADLDAAVRTIAGSARSMGLDVEG